MPTKKKGTYYPYKLARLIHYDFSSDKSWYIDFSAYDVKIGRLRRKRISEFNNIKNIDQRTTFANNLVNEINEMLTNGFHFDNDRKKRKEFETSLKTHNGFLSIDRALDMFLDLKRNELSTRTHKSYESEIKRFKNWLNNDGRLFEGVKFLNKNDAIKYVDYLDINEGLSNKSINTRVGYMKSIFYFFIERELVNENIFKDIKKRKEVVTSKNIAYTDKQIKTIKEYLNKNNQDLWFFCQFIFYSFMRPAEIRSLKVKNVKLKDRYIYLPAPNSKVKTDRYVIITEPFKKVLDKMDVDWDDQECYIFSSNIHGKYRPVGISTFGNAYREVMVKLKFSNDNTLYSWKHTGNVKAYKNGVGLYSIMRQNGHTQIETTMNYLKTLGLVKDDEFINKFGAIEL